MKTIKKHFALGIVMALVMAGGLLLAFDYEDTRTAWTAVISAIVLLALAIVLTFYFDRKNMLPE